MRIIIPKEIRDNLEQLESVIIEMDDASTPGRIIPYSLPFLHISRCEYANIIDHQWNSCTYVKYIVSYKDGRQEIFDFESKDSAKYLSTLDKATQACIRTNKNSKFKDNAEGRKECLEAIDSLLSAEKKTNYFSASTKTLVYYTVYFNKGYVELFDLSVRSLLKNSSKPFDILVITDIDTKQYIEKTEAAKLTNFKFFITDTPADGVEASKMKIDIFRYPDILNYGKVLFLDCDIVAQRSIDEIIGLEIHGGKLYTARNKNLWYPHFKTVHHGFRCLTDEFIEEMKLGEQIPFNAGQFMFEPSPGMLKHFENVRWFMDNWPSEYFFEQCFMCYYFCRGYLTEPWVLRKYIGINSTTHKDIVDDDIPGKTLVHFIAPPLDAETKLKYIEDYLMSQEKGSAKPGILDKLKGWFKKK
jgi:hypothetical protein